MKLWFFLFPLYIVSRLESGMLHFFSKWAHTKSLIYLFHWDHWSDFWRDIPLPQDFKFCFHKISFVIQCFLDFSIGVIAQEQSDKDLWSNSTLLFLGETGHGQLIGRSILILCFYFLNIFNLFQSIIWLFHDFSNPEMLSCVHLWGGGGRKM